MCIDKNAPLSQLAADLASRGALAVLLYGSVARGEQDAGSDVDILEVVESATEPFSQGQIQISPYTLARLQEMAARGSLFVRHIVDEAKPLFDPEHILNRLRAAYQEVPDDTHTRELRIASGLLNVSQSYYDDFWPGLHACATFILRSLAYIEARQKGCTSFSMARVHSLLRDARLEHIKHLRESTTSCFPIYCEVIATIESFQKSRAFNRFGSVEALTVNSWKVHDMTFVWGLRILTRNAARFTYG